MRTQIQFGMKLSTPTHFKIHSTKMNTPISTKTFKPVSRSDKGAMFKSTRFFLKSQNKILRSPFHQRESPHSPLSQSSNCFLPPLGNALVNSNNKSKQKHLNTSSNIKSNECDQLTNEYFFLYRPSKHSEASFDAITAYGTNTFQGLVRNYNEDRVSVIINAKCPYQGTEWPNVSFFAIYDGHAGNKCADYLKSHLHNMIFKSQFFPHEPMKAIEESFAEIERNFNKSVYKNKIYNDYSGSCALITLIINKTCYVVNLGDSRALYSYGGGAKLYQITRDHKPNDPIEHQRILKGGGSIYQTPGTAIGFQLPYRINPGKLSVARAIGDIEAKLPLYGGNPNVLISKPSVYKFEIEDESDFIVMGCDGIYDKLSNLEIFDVIWKFKQKGFVRNNIHELSGLVTDAVMKLSLKKYTTDNITCIFISFENFKKKMSEESYERRIFGAIPSMVVHQMNGEVDLSGFNHQNGLMNCFQSKKLK